MSFSKSPIAILALFVIAGDALAQPVSKPALMIVVEASYPGANAKVVADTVAAPIEQAVNGVPNMLQMASRCSNDGSYVLAVTFKPGADLDKAQVLVQNRVTLALPALPDIVKQRGVTVRKKSPVLMLINLSSPKGKHDTVYLSNYATVQIKDELARLPTVGAITLYGTRDQSMRAWLDPLRLEARRLTAADVIQAIRQQNVQVAAGRIGQPPSKPGTDFQYSFNTLGRLADPKEFADIIVKTEKGGNIVRLKDVGRVELGAAFTDGDARFNGKPGVVLGVFPMGGTSAKKVSQAVANKLGELRKRLPEGLNLEVAFDFTANLDAPDQPTTPEYLLIDLEPLPTASFDRIDAALKSCEERLRDVKGIQDVLSLAANPFDFIRNQPCILVRLAPADQRKISRAEMMRTIRSKLNKVPNTVLRLRDLSRRGGYGYAIDLAVTAPEVNPWELAQELGARLRKSKKLTDVSVDPESRPRSHLVFDIDRTKAKNLGVATQDIFSTMEAYFGSMYVNDFNRFGPSWQVAVSAKAKKGDPTKDLMNVKVRNNQGQMVPLDKLVSVRSIEGPGTIHRIDLRPAVFVTANPVPGTPLKEARAVCEAQFEEARRELGLSAEYRLIRLQRNSASD